MKNLEVFKSAFESWTENGETIVNLSGMDSNEEAEDYESGQGWFFWFCMPGCLPDSEPFGPYSTKKQALAEARRMFAEVNHG
jgi:hypothetical protein